MIFIYLLREVDNKFFSHFYIWKKGSEVKSFIFLFGNKNKISSSLLFFYFNIYFLLFVFSYFGEENKSVNLFGICLIKKVLKKFPAKMTQNHFDNVNSFCKMIFIEFRQLNPPLLKYFRRY